VEERERAILKRRKRKKKNRKKTVGGAVFIGNWEAKRETGFRGLGKFEELPSLLRQRGDNNVPRWDT
jgi:hypothetical protein